MKPHNILLVVPIIIFSGCTSISSDTKYGGNEKTVIDVIDKFKNDTQKGISLYDLYDPSDINPGFTKLGNGYSAYQRWWCSKEYDGESKLNDLIMRYCESKSGFFSNGWCHIKDGALFRVKIGQADLIAQRTATPFCTSGYELGVFAVTGENQHDISMWNDWIVTNLSYRTPEQISQEREESNREAVKRAELEQATINLNTNAILASGVGTKVCQRKGDITYFGFVEKIENGKLNILLYDAFYKTNRNIKPGGFDRRSIWDEPKNWALCMQYN